jgi:hypothetical protein
VHWVLRVELDDEWEECTFHSRWDALSTFVALASDYEQRLKRAILMANYESVAVDAFPRASPPAQTIHRRLDLSFL